MHNGALPNFVNLSDILPVSEMGNQAQQSSPCEILILIHQYDPFLWGCTNEKV
jgi:hypothetical protein